MLVSGYVWSQNASVTWPETPMIREEVEIMPWTQQNNKMLAIHFSENFILCPSYRKQIFVSLLAVDLETKAKTYICFKSLRLILQI